MTNLGSEICLLSCLRTSLEICEDFFEKAVHPLRGRWSNAPNNPIIKLGSLYKILKGFMEQGCTICVVSTEASRRGGCWSLEGYNDEGGVVGLSSEIKTVGRIWCREEIWKVLTLTNGVAATRKWRTGMVTGTSKGTHTHVGHALVATMTLDRSPLQWSNWDRGWRRCLQ